MGDDAPALLDLGLEHHAGGGAVRVGAEPELGVSHQEDVLEQLVEAGPVMPEVSNIAVVPPYCSGTSS